MRPFGSLAGKKDLMHRLGWRLRRCGVIISDDIIIKFDEIVIIFDEIIIPASCRIKAGVIEFFYTITFVQ